MNAEAEELSLTLVKVKPKDQLICDFLNAQGHNVIIKDIENFRRKIFSNDSSDHAMLHLISKLESEQYDVRFRVNIYNELESIFWIHQTAIENVKRFPEVLVMGATYSNNRHKLPFINIAGIGSLLGGRRRRELYGLLTFNVAGGWMYDEKESSYKWFLEQLKSAVWPGEDDDGPDVMVTDRDMALKAAIVDVFSCTKRINCHFHIICNFKSNVKKLVSQVEWNGVVEALKKIKDSKTETEYLVSFNEYSSIAERSQDPVKMMNYMKQ